MSTHTSRSGATAPLTAARHHVPMTAVAVSVLVLTVVTATTGAGGAVAAQRRFGSCKALNAVYPHGVGVSGAVDRRSDGAPPVTNFRVDADVYWAQIADTGARGRRAFGGRLDRDNDGIACEHV